MTELRPQLANGFHAGCVKVVVRRVRALVAEMVIGRTAPKRALQVGAE